MSNKRFFVNKISSQGIAEIQGEDIYHILKVLRLKKGDSVSVFNYEHGEFKAEIIEISKKKIKVKIIEKIKSIKIPDVKIIGIISLIKKENFEFVLQKLTELGIDKIIPVITDRTVIKIKSIDSKIERWRKIIYEAVKQSGRIIFPELEKINKLKKLKFEKDSHKLLIWEKENKNLLIDEIIKLNNNIKKVYFIIGPEGGFEDSEISFLKDNGFKTVSLGNTTLRAETASIITAGILVQYLRRGEWKI